MRNIRIAPDEHYHLFNRGMIKQNIFLDKNDYSRFLFLILYFQSPVTIPHPKRFIKSFVQHSVFDISVEEKQKIIKNRYVELVSFCLMPNHFHLIIREVKEGGISKYMQRVLNSYTKYFNKRYEKSGHLFQGPYKAVHIKDDNHLLYLSTYIHKNPTELNQWKGKEKTYIWSSYQDYGEKNRFSDLLVLDVVSEQFENITDYEYFVQTSTAKTIREKLDDID